MNCLYFKTILRLGSFLSPGYLHLIHALMSSCFRNIPAKRNLRRDCWRPSHMPKGLACCNELNKRDKTIGGNGVPVQKSIRENPQKAISYSKQATVVTCIWASLLHLGTLGWNSRFQLLLWTNYFLLAWKCYIFFHLYVQRGFPEYLF